MPTELGDAQCGADDAALNQGARMGRCPNLL